MAKLRAKIALKISIIPCMGIRFLATTWPFFVQSGWFFLVTQETIISVYWLAMRNHDFDAFLEKVLFLAGKWAWRPPWRQRVWGLKSRSKSWPAGWTFWVNRYIENLFSKISGLNPPKFSEKTIVEFRFHCNYLYFQVANPSIICRF